MPLHALDNLTNLSNTGTARTNLGLGTGDSPQFTSITLTSGGTITGNVTLTGNLTASGIVTSPYFSVAGTTGGEFVASKSVLSWAFGSKASTPLTADSAPTGVDFKPDGTVMFVLGSTNRRVYAYNLSPAWDVSTASVTPSLSTIVLDSGPEGVRFSPDGKYMFVVSSASDVVRRYTMSTGNEWNISTITTSDQTFGLPVGVARGLCFKPDGTKMYVFDDNTNNILEYTLSPAWTITGATLANSVVILDSIREIDISSDGKRIFAIVDGTAGLDLIYEYTLPTAWSISGMYISGRMYRSTDFTAFPAGGPVAPESGPSGIYYNDVLNKCFFVGTSTDRVQEIDVTPQPAILGTRPVIQSNTTNSVADRVTMNSLQITDTTLSTSGTTGALLVAGGIGASNNINCGGSMSATSFQAGASSGLTWSSRSLINSPADGVIRLTNNAVTGFDRLQFGGTTSTFPAIKVESTELHIKNADNTAFNTIRAGGYKSSDGFAGTSGSFIADGNTITVKNGLITAITPIP
jgi:hypothetical protein